MRIGQIRSWTLLALAVLAACLGTVGLALAEDSQEPPVLPLSEVERLVQTAAVKLDAGDSVGAGIELERAAALTADLPPDYDYQKGRYHAALRQGPEAKKSLEAYLTKAGKDGASGPAAQALLKQVVDGEKRWARFKANRDGTVTDLQTGLMWAARDNGQDINWPNAKSYCAKFRAGAHSDWRLPTQAELATLRDPAEPKGHTPLIEITACCPWASETRGDDAASFVFSGKRECSNKSCAKNARALPVRRAQ